MSDEEEGKKNLPFQTPIERDKEVFIKMEPQFSAGEIIAYRAWRIVDRNAWIAFTTKPEVEWFWSGCYTNPIVGFDVWPKDYWGHMLCSFTQSALWYPDRPMKGDPYAKGYFEVPAGVYALKTKSFVDEHIGTYYSGDWATFSYIRGTVALFGEVLEHENGYRAQYARVIDLDFVDMPGVVIEELKEYYSL